MEKGTNGPRSPATSAVAGSRSKNEQARKKGRLVPLQLAVFFLLLGLVSSGFARYVLFPQQSPASGLPEYIGSLKLASSLGGENALADINRLHGTRISLDNAFIGEYQAPYGGRHLRIWLGEAGSQAAADELIEKMVQGIARGGSGFANPRTVTISGREVWQADGKGGQFFFFRSADPPDRVVWVTIEDHEAAPLLESVLKSY